ncbi:deoxyribonuclease IV [Buchnera aphidicola (Taiwanaphis decaspermi)]|uniref:deoxyribonuclease IV n=1 Tax=Buchnera aphidicola TaxID=9 RepID=UPI0031B81980
MKYIGPHISISGGINLTVLRAHKLEATAFAFFTKNQLRWNFTNIDEKKIISFKNNCIKYKFKSSQILPHAGYLINLGHPDNNLLKKSRLSFIEEILICEKLGLKFLNFHPGSHLRKITEKKCLNIISDSINISLNKTNKLILLIENTAGQGSNMGYNLEHLFYIINKIENKSRIGVCIDTCHSFVSGYDLRTENDCNIFFKKYDDIIGFKYLRAMHLNDSKKELFSKVDRHENLGKGKIGNKLFSYIMRNKKFNNIPLILETPNSSLWEKEIKFLKKMTNI